MLVTESNVPFGYMYCDIEKNEAKLLVKGVSCSAKTVYWSPMIGRHPKTVKFVCEKFKTAKLYNGYSYVYHCLSVMDRLVSTCCPPTIYIAGLLHDILEDTNCTVDELKNFVGAEVTQLVFAVTDEPGENRKARIASTYPKIEDTENACLVKLADRIENVLHCNDRLKDMYFKEAKSFDAMIEQAAFSESLKSSRELLRSQLRLAYQIRELKSKVV